MPTRHPHHVHAAPRRPRWPRGRATSRRSAAGRGQPGPARGRAAAGVQKQEGGQHRQGHAEPDREEAGAGPGRAASTGSAGRADRETRSPKTRSSSPPTWSARRTVEDPRSYFLMAPRSREGLLVLAVEAVQVLVGLFARPRDRGEEVALDVLLLPLRGLGDLLERVLPPLDGLGRHVGRADHSAHLLPVEVVALLGEGRHVGGVGHPLAAATARFRAFLASIWATISLGFSTAASTWPPISAAVTSPPELKGTYFTLMPAAFSKR